LRGGAFSEKRIIELVNSKMVCFYFCFRKQGRRSYGYDEEALKVHNKFVTKSELKTGIPPVLILSPGGKKLLGKINQIDLMYKNVFFTKLVEILKKHDYLDSYIKDDKKILDKAKESPTTKNLYEAGKLYETLGLYEDAKKMYLQATEKQTISLESLQSLHNMARISRYQKDWKSSEEFLSQLKELDPKNKFLFFDDVAVETAHRLIGNKEYTKAREYLNQFILKNPTCERLAELHFQTGVACYMQKDDKVKDWAYYHWWHVMKKMPKSPFSMRSFVAVADRVFPFPNVELGGKFKKPGTSMTIAGSDKERKRTEKIYEKLRKEYESQE